MRGTLQIARRSCSSRVATAWTINGLHSHLERDGDEQAGQGGACQPARTHKDNQPRRGPSGELVSPLSAGISGAKELSALWARPAELLVLLNKLFGNEIVPRTSRGR